VPSLNILRFFLDQAKQLLFQITQEMKITVTKIICVGKSNNYGQDGVVFVLLGAAGRGMEDGVILQEYAPLILQKCDKPSLAILLLGLHVDAATLRPDSAESLVYGLWVRLDSNPIVPYTGLPKAEQPGSNRNLRSYTTR